MKNLKMMACIAASLLMSVSVAGAVTPPHTTLTPDQAFAQLQAGNAQFVKGRVLHLTAQSQPSVRISSGTIGQGPYAVVLGCIDSRVPPEIIFDRGLNEVFSVRVAGNIIADHELGSIEYAVGHVEVPLIVVLGHSKCGAVTETAKYVRTGVNVNTCSLTTPVDAAVPPAVDSLINYLKPTVAATYNASLYCVPGTGVSDANLAKWVEAAATQNINDVAASIEAQSEEIRLAIEAGKVKIKKGKYDVVTGVVTWLP